MIPKISIIIPCYNTEKYLDDCFSSIEKQSLKDIEIICIDDKSTDSTLKILKNYSSKDKRISVIEKDKNEGAGKARNIGIDNAVGDYVVFMDPDDCYPENTTLEKLYSAITKNNVFVAGGNLIKQTPENKIIETKFYKTGLYNYKNSPFSYGYTLFIYKRDFLVKNKIYFPDYKRYQDPPFLVKTMIKAKRFYAITDAVYVYRVSYKKVDWTESKMLDVLNGISDILLLSKKHNIYKLYIEQINILWYEIAYAYTQTNSFDSVKNKLLDIFNNIDTSILSKHLCKKLKNNENYCDLIKTNKIIYKKLKPYIKSRNFISKIYRKENCQNGLRNIYFCGFKIFSYKKG